VFYIGMDNGVGDGPVVC